MKELVAGWQKVVKCFRCRFSTHYEVLCKLATRYFTKAKKCMKKAQ